MTQAQLTTGIAVVAAVAVISIFFIFKNPFMNQDDTSRSAATSTATDTSTSTPAANPSLVVQDEQVGTGAVAQAGDIVTVDYTGKFQNGSVFDTSVGKKPIQFTLGAGNVIPGFDQGVQGMKVGGKRLLIIPPSLGYGSQQVGPIPPNSTLVFEITLVQTQKGSAAPAVTPAH